MMAAFKEMTHGPFDLLPDEMVVYTLIFIDADELLNCRLVCKRWQELIDSCVFQLKASRENEFVNNGRGYHSFSEIDSYIVRRLELPWYVFHVICKYDPFNRNLVKNHCGQDNFNQWDITCNDGSWLILNELKSVLPNDADFDGHSSYFAAMFGPQSAMRQNIEFKNYGLNDVLMTTLQPEISVSEWFRSCNGLNCYYGLIATVYDRNDERIDQYDYNGFLPPLEKDKDTNWKKISHLFKNQTNASYVNLTHFGIDLPIGYGHNGTKISCSVVKVLLPLKFKCTI